MRKSKAKGRGRADTGLPRGGEEQGRDEEFKKKRGGKMKARGDN